MQVQAQAVHDPGLDKMKLKHCRFCAKRKKLEDLYDISSEQKSFEQYLNLIDFFKIDYIDLFDEKLPKTLCLPCHNKCQLTYKFFTKIKNSQIVLNCYYNIKEELLGNEFEENTESVKVVHAFVDERKRNPKTTNQLTPRSDNECPSKTSSESVLVKTEDLNEIEDFTENTFVDEHTRNPKTTNPSTPGSDNEHPGKKSSESVLVKTEDLNEIEDFTQNTFVDERTRNPETTNPSTPGSDNEHPSKTSSESVLVKTEDLNKIEDCNTFVDERTRNPKTTNPSTPGCDNEYPSGISFNINDTHEFYISGQGFNDSSAVSQLTASEERGVPFIKADLDCIDSDTSVLKNDTQKSNKDTVDSWMSYPWACRLCETRFDSAEKVRRHSKELHGKCYGFSCDHCRKQFNKFNSFIEHVRQHRNELRYYCQYCNKKFEGPIQCEEHTLAHCSGSQKICDLCGEIFPDANTLASHTMLYKRVTLLQKSNRKKPQIVASRFTYNGIPVYQREGWDTYQWSCQECFTTTPDADSLRDHVQDAHSKCFAMKCVDCLIVLSNYQEFVTHVTEHRPYLKEFCQYCNKHIEDPTKMTQHINNFCTVDQTTCHRCGEIFDNATQLLRHVKQFNRPNGTLTIENGLTRNVYQKTFKNLSGLRTHNKNRQTDHMLNSHKRTHSDEKQEICLVCEKLFPTKILLNKHVEIHKNPEVYACDECGKKLDTKYQLRHHIKNHDRRNKKFPCVICQKKFNSNTNLKIHMYIHKA